MLSVENNVKLLNKDALGVSELLILFNYEKTVSEIPFRPKGGDIFMCNNTAGRKDDWKADETVMEVRTDSKQYKLYGKHCKGL